MPLKRYKYTILRGYCEVTGVDTLQEARRICEDDVKSNNVAYTFVKQVKTKLKDASGQEFPTYILIYQYRTLYFETYLVVSNDEYGGMKRFCE